MTAFSEMNPAAVFVYYLLVLLIAMFSSDPIITAISITGALIYMPRLNLVRHPLFRAGAVAGFVVIMSLINPLISHNGTTVLFFLNNNPVTLEALMYGLNSSMIIAAVFIRLSAFSRIMTNDRILYIFTGLSPKIALVLSMSLRFIPLFVKRYGEIRRVQRVLGECGDESLPGRLKSSSKAFSILVTWAIENGITTAQSMEARDFGKVRRRSSYVRFSFGCRDVAVMIITVMLFIGTLLMQANSDAFMFYPYMNMNISVYSVVGYILYGIMMLIPVVTDLWGVIRWNYLTAGI